MSKVYNTQTDLKLVVQTGKDLTTASEVKLKYTDPKGQKGELDVTIPTPEIGILVFETPAGEPFNVIGNWSFWAYIVDGGRVSIGEAFNVRFFAEGQ